MSNRSAALSLRLERQRGALLRAIGTIERRGFTLQHLECNGTQLRCELGPSTRDVEVLINMLRKQEDIREVRLCARRT